MLDEFSSAGAILAEAEAREADCVVVGTRRDQSWIDELGSGRVATQVIERAGCSVLVLPLDGGHPASLGTSSAAREPAIGAFGGLRPFAGWR